jgi:hypothetical protein
MSHSHTAHLLEYEFTSEIVEIGSRFCGPPGSGNGGYSVGLLGKHLGREVEVTLKRPIPLDEPLRVVPDGAVTATLMHEGEVVATARRAELDIEAAPPVGFARAAAARVSYPGYEAHPFPSCFVCGTNRSPGDGMCLFTGVLEEGVVASSWIPAGDMVTPEGTVTPELICAALDCPGAWSLISRYDIEGPFVLGRMTYRLEQPIRPGDQCVVMGWALGRDGRKARCGTAIYDARGQVCAVAGATWFQLTR